MLKSGIIMLEQPHNKYWLPDEERKRLIKEGDKYSIEACMRLYLYYEFSRHDHARAVMWLKMAKESGSKEAALLLKEKGKKTGKKAKSKITK